MWKIFQFLKKKAAEPPATSAPQEKFRTKGDVLLFLHLEVMKEKRVDLDPFGKMRRQAH